MDILGNLVVLVSMLIITIEREHLTPGEAGLAIVFALMVNLM